MVPAGQTVVKLWASDFITDTRILRTVPSDQRLIMLQFSSEPQNRTRFQRFARHYDPATLHVSDVERMRLLNITMPKGTWEQQMLIPLFLSEYMGSMSKKQKLRQENSMQCNKKFWAMQYYWKESRVKKYVHFYSGSVS